MPWYLDVFFWLFGFLFLWRIPFLTKKKGARFSAKHVSVIIPARNEERSLVRLLGSLEHQTDRAGEIIVVDDQSEDATAEVSRRLGATVITSKDLPDGWVGKPWACWQGANQACGSILLFLDADTFLEPEGLAKIVSTFEGEGLLSIQPFHRMGRLYERLSAISNIIVMASMKAFTILGSKTLPLGAFGPCIVCSKDTYFRLRGHQRVRGEILENLVLGKKFIRSGYRVRCYGGKGTLSFRMYPQGLRSLFSGFSRSLATGSQTMSFFTLLLIVCWVAGAFGVTRHLLQSAFLGDVTGLALWGGLDVLYILQIHWMLSRIGNFGFVTALLFQVPLLFFAVAFFWSLVLTFFKRRVRWKGRFVRPGEGKTAS
jgi:4,4'-diaponeurosporenoate glycosyltransferase